MYKKVYSTKRIQLSFVLSQTYQSLMNDVLFHAKTHIWLNYPDKCIGIKFWQVVHLWWSLLLYRAIANEFHHTNIFG